MHEGEGRKKQYVKVGGKKNNWVNATDDEEMKEKQEGRGAGCGAERKKIGKRGLCEGEGKKK